MRSSTRAGSPHVSSTSAEPPCVAWFQDGRVNVLYSTPSIYVDALHSSNVSWPLKKGDFFP